MVQSFGRLGSATTHTAPGLHPHFPTPGGFWGNDNLTLKSLAPCHGPDGTSEGEKTTRALTSRRIVAQRTRAGRVVAGQWPARTWAACCWQTYVCACREACVVSVRVARERRSLPMEPEPLVPSKLTGRSTRQVRLCTTASVDAP